VKQRFARQGFTYRERRCARRSFKIGNRAIRSGALSGLGTVPIQFNQHTSGLDVDFQADRHPRHDICAGARADHAEALKSNISCRRRVVKALFIASFVRTCHLATALPAPDRQAGLMLESPRCEIAIVHAGIHHRETRFLCRSAELLENWPARLKRASDDHGNTGSRKPRRHRATPSSAPTWQSSGPASLRQSSMSCALRFTGPCALRSGSIAPPVRRPQRLGIRPGQSARAVKLPREVFGPDRQPASIPARHANCAQVPDANPPPSGRRRGLPAISGERPCAKSRIDADRLLSATSPDRQTGRTWPSACHDNRVTPIDARHGYSGRNPDWNHRRVQRHE